MEPIKQRLQELAILGGKPAFDEKLYVGRPNVPDKKAVLRRIEAALDSRWLSNDGPMVREFESKIADQLGVRNAIAVTNATAGLELLARGLGLEGEVLVPAFTFVATAHALRWCGLIPIPVDVDPATHLIDPRDAARRVTERTRGILGVHLWGRTCDVESLELLARNHGLHLIFDAAHAFLCGRDGRMVGGFGAAEVFSFHATKFLNTFEGGAITTDDPELAERLRLMRNFGFTGYDRVEHLGCNAKMHEASAAMGLAGLEQADEVIERNRQNLAAYRQALADIPGVQLHRPQNGERSNFQYVVIEVESQATGLSRDDLVQVLWAENVIARRYFVPGIHRAEPYATELPKESAPYPVTDRLCERVMVLPTGTAVTPEDVLRIGGVLRTAVNFSKPLRRSREMAA